jgi:hypothetical protein
MSFLGRPSSVKRGGHFQRKVRALMAMSKKPSTIQSFAGIAQNIHLNPNARITQLLKASSSH